MRILVDIGHPAHVHLFRHAMGRWENRGHKVTITVRDKDVALQLLSRYGFSYEVTSKGRSGIGLALEIAELDWGVLRSAMRNKSELLIGSTVAVSHVARLVGARSIVFNEDDAAVGGLYPLLAYPLAHTIVTPSCLDEDYGERHVTYGSYQELAYLHPNVFRANPEVLGKLGVTPAEPYFILRFVALRAAHDRGQRGLSLATRRRLVWTLSDRGKVFITSEGSLPEELRPYRIQISPEDMHDALAFATLLISDSQTMTAEAAVLGTPSIRCNSFVGRISYLEELEHEYGLTYGFLPQDEDQMFEKILELLAWDDLHEEWQRRRQIMLADKIDLTAWMVDFVEQYPHSLRDYRERSGGAASL